MSKTPSFYSCGNEFGADPCVFALENRRIPASEAIPDMDGSGSLKCRGKTRSGKDCLSKLTPLPEITPPCWKKKKFLLPAAVMLLLLIWIILLIVNGSSKQPSLKITPADRLSFTRTSTEATSGSIQISNQGDEELVVTKIQASPPQFTTTETELQVKPGESATLFINFSSPSTEAVKGQLTLQTNDPEKSSVIVSLIVNQNGSKDPWWVYQQLETSSKIILRTEP